MKTMSRPTIKRAMKGMKNNGDDEDLISQLPDEVLCCIISSFSIDEAVKSSILSKRWRSPLWKYSSRFDFDVTHMIKPLSQLQNPITFGLNLTIEEAIGRYGNLVNTMLNDHLDLKILKLKWVVMKEEMIKGPKPEPYNFGSSVDGPI
ncbi:Leucine-rich repeat domain superfamily [Sesbania bispinosa]|nr:Leucine-rich repeat domain superfamily [Sesbania bispinosa]